MRIRSFLLPVLSDIGRDRCVAAWRLATYAIDKYAVKGLEGTDFRMATGSAASCHRRHACFISRARVLQGLLLGGLMVQWRWLWAQFRNHHPVSKQTADMLRDANEAVRNETATIEVIDSEPRLGTPRDTTTVNNCSILDDSCIDQLAAKLRRIWPSRPIETWCSGKHSKNVTSASLLRLVKVPKSASSTAAAVVLRIQHRHDCAVGWDHGRAADILPPYWNASAHSMRRRRHSLLLVAPVRTPHSRALSVVYYNHISFHRRHRVPLGSNNSSTVSKTRVPADKFIVKHLEQVPSNSICDYMQYALPSAGSKQQRSDIASPTPNSTTTLEILSYVQGIMNAYDFLLVSNRMDESLVVLSLLTNLPITSVLTMSSKSTGSWYLTSATKQIKSNGSVGTKPSSMQCIPLVPPVTTRGIETYFASHAWKQRHAADRLLFAAANQSLDAMIQALPLFAERHQEYQTWKARIQANCVNETYFPCSSSGIPQLEESRRSCYERDFGCGYPCIDRMIEQGD
jgi:hypothetical protein